jgi:hypothetical protein
LLAQEPPVLEEVGVEPVESGRVERLKGYPPNMGQDVVVDLALVLFPRRPSQLALDCWEPGVTERLSERTDRRPISPIAAQSVEFLLGLGLDPKAHTVCLFAGAVRSQTDIDDGEPCRDLGSRRGAAAELWLNGIRHHDVATNASAVRGLDSKLEADSVEMVVSGYKDYCPYGFELGRHRFTRHLYPQGFGRLRE